VVQGVVWKVSLLAMSLSFSFLMESPVGSFVALAATVSAEATISVLVKGWVVVDIVDFSPSVVVVTGEVVVVFFGTVSLALAMAVT